MTLKTPGEHLATIQDLPHELLADIFTIVAIPPSDTGINRSFIPLRLVCRGWDVVACATAGLWADIRAYRKTRIEWIQFCLERSAQAPLELLFVMLAKEKYTEMMPLLSRADNSCRIRCLRIRENGTGICPALFPLHSLAMPSLQKLETSLVYVPGLEREDSLPLCFPQLHSLKLSGVSIPKDPAFYANLRSLAVHRNCCSELQFTVADLVAVLGSIRRLEALDLSNFEPYDVYALEVPRYLNGVVHLPYLRSYTIENSLTVCSRINRILSFPSSTVLSVRAVMQSAAMRYVTASDAVAEIFLPSIRASVENVAAMIVSCGDRHFDIRIPATPDSTDVPRVRIEAWQWYGSSVPPQFAAFLPFCPSDRLTDLTLLSIQETRSVANWAAVFRTYATLERLKIVQAQCDVSNVFAALTPQGPDQPEERQELLCPALRRVDVEVSTRTNKVLRSLCGCLVKCATARAKRGARRFESLTVVWEHRGLREDVALPDDPIWERVVGRLQSLVDEGTISARSLAVR
ncbi:hypothetical protein C8Q80DRAFT_1265933 [Daedaleopsis nitida]|nr:hypothetical protein C8Q80DRAFT_1265933 [Daedaleopsis nitida]